VFSQVRWAISAPGGTRTPVPLLRSYPRPSAVATSETHVTAERHSPSYLLTGSGPVDAVLPGRSRSLRTWPSVPRPANADTGARSPALIAGTQSQGTGSSSWLAPEPDAESGVTDGCAAWQCSGAQIISFWASGQSLPGPWNLFREVGIGGRYVRFPVGPASSPFSWFRATAIHGRARGGPQRSGNGSAPRGKEQPGVLSR
jgi:hypothetical protein